eukprot:7381360-Prymnesium_polylepis.3
MREGCTSFLRVSGVAGEGFRLFSFLSPLGPFWWALSPASLGASRSQRALPPRSRAPPYRLGSSAEDTICRYREKHRVPFTPPRPLDSRDVLTEHERLPCLATVLVPRVLCPLSAAMWVGEWAADAT